MGPHRLPLTYVLPLRWTDDADLDELTAYLRGLAGLVQEVLVVDGSPPPLHAAHARAWHGLVRHERPDPWPGCNGKVAGVMTGVRLARHERLVLADDDVRHDRGTLTAIDALLDGADAVRPQNYFDPLPWHAVWDSGRTLLNRALGADYPGTLGVRRSILLATGGYDGDVLFENLELLRTVRAAGGREVIARDVLVARRPPTARHFAGQRVRQAYDSLGQPARLVAELALAPALVWAG
ncbi:glycosyltransferase, partial [Cellulomonas cellasea]